MLGCLRVEEQRLFRDCMVCERVDDCFVVEFARIPEGEIPETEIAETEIAEAEIPTGEIAEGEIPERVWLSGFMA